MDEILDADEAAAALRRFLARASAARPAPHGKDTRGIFRVHQFDKVEMFSLLSRPRTPGTSTSSCSRWRSSSSTSSDLPYRVIDIAAGDLGASAAQEVRHRGLAPGPGQATASSPRLSNCTDYQARRLDARMRGDGRRRARAHAQRHAGSRRRARWSAVLDDPSVPRRQREHPRSPARLRGPGRRSALGLRAS